MNERVSTILKLEPASHKWWNKPLVSFGGRALPAELAVLALELSPGEKGVWMNSRGTANGVVGLTTSPEGSAHGKYVTQRISLPGFVSEMLKRMYQVAEVKRGCPDLVIWNEDSKQMRLVEVKCPRWDRPSKEQELFLKAADKAGIPAKIVEWEFHETA
jgi:hypothetical protein